MIRKFNSVAIAALAMMAAAGAQAQSSVSVYGTVDVSFGTFKNAAAGTTAVDPYETPDTTDSRKRIQGVESGKMQTSYIGFAGTEDLGGGLKAKFKLESFIAADTGGTIRQNKTAGFWGRNSWVGLTGGFGSVVAGLNETPLFDATLAFNPFAASFGFSPAIRQYYIAPGNYGHVAEDTSWSNSVTYYTPDGLGGFNGALQYSFKETSGGSGNVGGSIGWGAGPFAVAAVFQQYKTGYTNGSQNTWQIDGSYDFGVFKLFGQYGEVKDTSTVQTAYTNSFNFKDKIWQIGGSVPLGSGVLLASYGEQKHDLNATGESDKNDTFSLAYDYNLSKRTDVYVAYMYDKASVKGVSPAVSFDNANTLAVGLKHRF